jgi:RraA family protein
MTLGFRIRRNWNRLDRKTVAMFADLPVANVSDCMSRLSAGGASLRPMHRAGGLIGSALTVRTRPGDNLMLHKAIDMAEEGDVIVVDGGGDTTNALIGELMLAHAIRRGVAGVVINGAVRDAKAISELDWPVFAVGVTHRGPYKDGPGEIGFPISIGGLVIESGDVILGDEDGVVSVPKDQVETVYAAARRKQDAETRQMQQTESGSMDRGWIDRTLERLGCEYV